MSQNSTVPFDQAAIQVLRSQVRGSVLVPGDAGYDQASLTWETIIFRQRPAIIVMPLDSIDVRAAVLFANAHQLPVAVQGGGHGHAFPAETLEQEHALLLNFASMKGIEIDPQRAIARIEPGVTWSEVIPLAHEHGLAPLNGFAGGVGAVGYLLGGGFGWLVRQYGLGAGSIRALDMVMADGQALHVNERNPELLWGMRGGGGNFGVVTAIECALYPVSEVFGGQAIYPAEQSKAVITAYMAWAKTVPETLTSTVRIMHFPPGPGIPPMLQGRSTVIVVGCYNGTEADGAALFAPMRTLGTPLLDTFAHIPYTKIGTISNDPDEAPPLYFYNSHKTLYDFTAAEIDALVAVAADPASGIFEVELRQLGGVLARIPEGELAASLREVRFNLYALAAAPTPELLAVGARSVTQIMQAAISVVCPAVLLNALAFNDIGPERTQAAFTPDNYRRLVALKRRYDPGNLFRFNNNIPPAPAPSAEGIITRSSPFAVTETLERLKTAMGDRYLKVFAEVDHGGEARRSGLTMQLAKLLIFGNPTAGTPLMAAAPLLALDLPLRLLVWQSGDGQVWVSSQRTSYLQARYGIPPELIGNIAGADALIEQVLQG